VESGLSSPGLWAGDKLLPYKFAQGGRPARSSQVDITAGEARSQSDRGYNQQARGGRSVDAAEVYPLRGGAAP